MAFQRVQAYTTSCFDRGLTPYEPLFCPTGQVNFRFSVASERSWRENEEEARQNEWRQQMILWTLASNLLLVACILAANYLDNLWARG
ncbi:hypothetical protein [Bradyrhizobium sp. CCBAU 11386]|uniref:hypothetical protein n=1 Tax=Bradyrhizobium sp. CCBAU 11386 TaxID=1630837 RepID=UPI002303F35F|nr:hypothetical protein [Bradyrhizobium sp. CCBAU 11386]